VHLTEVLRVPVSPPEKGGDNEEPTSGLDEFVEVTCPASWLGLANRIHHGILQALSIFVGHLGGSVVKHLPSVRVMILGSWDPALLRGKPASPSPTPPACVPAFAISLSLNNGQI